MRKTAAFIIAVLMALTLIPACFADGGYNVFCYDENGEPVEGVKVQLCDGKTCSLKTTDAEGKAFFGTTAPGEWEVYIAKVPEGYVKPDEVFLTSRDGSDVQFSVPTEAGAAALEKQDEAVVQEYKSLEEINFADYKVIAVNYWEPWCYWCLLEMPDLEKLYQEYRNQGLLIVGMYSDTEDFEEAIEAVGGISYPLIQYDDSEDSTAANAIPVTVFYDSEGQVLPPTEEEMYPYYAAYLKELVDSFDPADYPDENPETVAAYQAELEKLKDEEVLSATAWEFAKAWAESGSEVFSGYASGEIWRERIERRLNP